MSGMHTLYHKCCFSAAHRYWDDSLSEDANFQKYGLYSRIHGHNFSLIIGLQGQVDPGSGMLMDFNEIDDVVTRQVLQVFDTNYINEAHSWFSDHLPTTENLCLFIYNKLKDSFPQPVHLISVEVAENEDLSSKFVIERTPV